MTSKSHSSAAPRAQSNKRQAPEASVHMNVLGMDGTDHEFGVGWRNNNNNNTDDSTNNNTSHAEGTGNEMKTAQDSSVGPAGSLPSGPATPGRGRKPPPPSSPSAAARNIHNNNTEHMGQPTTGAPSSDKPKWWGKVLWGTTAGAEDNDDEASAQYQSLEAPEGEGPPQRMGIGNLSVSSIIASSSGGASTTTVEDRLKQDCSFFYQGIEDSPSGMQQPQQNPLMARRAAGLRPLASALNHQIPRLSTSREGARFRAHYERLNQDIVFTDSDDLFLDEYQEVGNPHHRQRGGGRGSGSSEVIDFSSTINTSQNTERLSTLFFEQDGRMLMKLPRDQVRLVMDQDLEPGIISVVQWRAVDKNQYNPAGPEVGDEEEGAMMILEDEGKNDKVLNKKRKQQPPSLRYVMTVPDDLYRRVVAEMSYALEPPCWGFFKCCDAEGRADIKLALVILAVILFLMFISTMEWPTD
jgi:hypothetical protein